MTGDPSVNYCMMFPLLESVYNTVYDYFICYKITNHVSENNTQHASVIFDFSPDISMSMSMWVPLWPSSHYLYLLHIIVEHSPKFCSPFSYCNFL